MVLKKINLFNGIMTGLKGEINGTHIREATASIDFYIQNGSDRAFSKCRLWKYLHLDDDTVKYNDFRVPYSYYRVEIDPHKTDTSLGYYVEDIGVDNDLNYFVNNCNVHLDGSPDFINVDMGVGCESVNKLKAAANCYFGIKLNKPNYGKVLKVTVEISVFYFYIPSLYSKKLDNCCNNKCCDDDNNNCCDNNNNNCCDNNNNNCCNNNNNCCDNNNNNCCDNNNNCNNNNNCCDNNNNCNNNNNCCNNNNSLCNNSSYTNCHTHTHNNNCNNGWNNCD